MTVILVSTLYNLQARPVHFLFNGIDVLQKKMIEKYLRMCETFMMYSISYSCQPHGS